MRISRSKIVYPFKRRVEGYLPDWSLGKYLGRLSTKVEAAGKIRVFAMVDP